MQTINFRQVVQEILDAHDWSESELASQVGSTQQHINRLRRGLVSQPNYALGDKLVRLWEARPYLKSGEARG